MKSEMSFDALITKINNALKMNNFKEINIKYNEGTKKTPGKHVRMELKLEPDNRMELKLASDKMNIEICYILISFFGGAFNTQEKMSRINNKEESFLVIREKNGQDLTKDTMVCVDLEALINKIKELKRESDNVASAFQVGLDTPSGSTAHLCS